MKKIQTTEELEKATASGFAVVVFKSEICPSCDAFDRYVKPLRELFPNAGFYEVSRSRSPLCEAFDVRGVPSLFVFCDGKLVASYNDGTHKSFMDVQSFLRKAFEKGDVRCFSNEEKN